MKKLTVAWLSAGVSSFIAAYLIRDEIDEFYYIDIDDQHPDSMRFIKDCETALGRPIKILKSNYGSVENAELFDRAEELTEKALCNVACLCPQWKAAGMCCECDVFYSLRDYHAEQLANNKEK